MTSADGADDQRRICPSCEAAYDGDLELCPIDGARLLFTRGEPDRFIGKTLDGRFRIDERIGGGAMGTVYKAQQHSVQRPVAVKIMNSKMGATAIGVRRFLREARLASKLSQPSTVSVLDFGQTRDGDLFLVMELLEGHTLLELMRNEGPFDLARVVRIGAQLCDALEAAHSLQIVHRDLKPGNIVILDNPPGRDLVKVLDFGLAKSIEGDESEATMTGQVVGTPRYMAPELWLGGSATAQSDLFALGILLGEMATGKPLFRAAGPGVAAQMAERLAAERPPLPEQIVPPLRPLIERLLAREARDRPSSAALVRAELLSFVGSSDALPIIASLDRPAPAPQLTEELTAATVAARRPAAAVDAPPRRRSRVPLILAGLVVGVVGVVLAFRFMSSGDEPVYDAPIAAPEPPTPAPPTPSDPSHASTPSPPPATLSTPHPDPPPSGGREKKKSRRKSVTRPSKPKYPF
jgi:serine/threonine-protein kinase